MDTGVSSKITQNGGYVLIDLASDKNGHNRRNFADYNVSPMLIAQLRDYTSKGLAIRRVRIGYHGEWFVQAEGVHMCFACPTGDTWAWGGVSTEAHNTFQRLAVLHRNANWTNRPTIRDVAFLPGGGYVAVFSKNDYYAAAAPAAAGCFKEPS